MKWTPEIGPVAKVWGVRLVYGVERGSVRVAFSGAEDDTEATKFWKQL